MGGRLFLLKEFRQGYGLFEFEFKGIPLDGLTLEHVRELNTEPYDEFMEWVQLVEFHNFDSDAQQQITAFSKGVVTAELRKFLLSKLPKIEPGKKNNFSLGVANPELGYHLYEVAKIPCQSTTFIREILLGLDLHIRSYLEDYDVTKVAIENVDDKEMDVEETPVQPSTKKIKKKKGKKRKSTEMDMHEAPTEPSSRKEKDKIQR